MDLHKKISEVAYDLYEKRGKAEGSDIRDWLEAEGIIIAHCKEDKLKAESSSPPKKKKESTTKRSINKAETKRKKN
jgi:hypothetical protein